MAKINVFKASKSVYTDKATPDLVEPIPDRKGILVPFSSVSAATTTVYTVPAGYVARLAIMHIWQLEAATAITVLIDGKNLYTRSGLVYPESPQYVAGGFNEAIEILSDIKCITAGTNPKNATFVIIQQRKSNA